MAQLGNYRSERIRNLPASGGDYFIAPTMLEPLRLPVEISSHEGDGVIVTRI